VEKRKTDFLFTKVWVFKQNGFHTYYPFVRGGHNILNCTDPWLTALFYTEKN